MTDVAGFSLEVEMGTGQRQSWTPAPWVESRGRRVTSGSDAHVDEALANLTAEGLELLTECVFRFIDEAKAP